jgi:hypothetical protein
MISVEVIPAEDVRRGDRIWAAEDGDWLLVDRIDNDGHEVVLYRFDHSEATFRKGARVLRQEGQAEEEPAGPPEPGLHECKCELRPGWCNC